LLTFSGYQLYCDISTGTPRPLVPVVLRRKLFMQLHSHSHPGVRASRRLLSRSYVWSKLSRDVGSWARSCLHCQRSKVQRHTRTPVPSIHVPSRRFSSLHVDLVGPLPPSNGYTYLLTVVDRTTRWPEAIPLSSITSEDCARALIAGWISRFGVPTRITSDRGTQFTSAIWASLCSFLGIFHTKTTSFHPQSNGLVERFHRSLKSSLRSRLAGSDWMKHLPLVMLGLRSVPKDDFSSSVAEAVYGSPLSLPGDFLQDSDMPPESFLSRMDSTLQGFSAPPTHHTAPSPGFVPSALRSTPFVFIREDASRPPLSPLYRGPYEVLDRSEKYFRIQIGDRQDTVSIDRLKPVLSDGPVLPQSPPRRGRPPNLPAPPRRPPDPDLLSRRSAPPRRPAPTRKSPDPAPPRRPPDPVLLSRRPAPPRRPAPTKKSPDPAPPRRPAPSRRPAPQNPQGSVPLPRRNPLRRVRFLSPPSPSSR